MSFNLWGRTAAANGLTLFVCGRGLILVSQVSGHQCLKTEDAAKLRVWKQKLPTLPL